MVTSGLDLEKFPPNIPVGRVASFSTPPGAAEPDITLTPLVNLDQLAYLQVLIWAPGSPDDGRVLAHPDPGAAVRDRRP